MNEKKLLGRKTKTRMKKSKAAISYSHLNSRLQLNNNIIYYRLLKCRGKSILKTLICGKSVHFHKEYPKESCFSPIMLQKTAFL